jgi:hypothetical protein
MDALARSDLVLGLAALLILATFVMLMALMFCDDVRD